MTMENSDTALGYYTWGNGYASQQKDEALNPVKCENCNRGYENQEHGVICSCCEGNWQDCPNCVEPKKKRRLILSGSLVRGVAKKLR